MNFGGLVATLALSGLALLIRRTGPRVGLAPDRATRRGLGLLALILPIAGLSLPFVPWRIMAILIVIVLVGSLMALLPLAGRATISRRGPGHPDDRTC